MSLPAWRPTCCSIPLQDGWGYCPECGESIDWTPPLTPEQIKANRIEHEHKMATDPRYKRNYEASQRMAVAWSAQLLKYYADNDDPFLGLTGLPK